LVVAYTALESDLERSDPKPLQELGTNLERYPRKSAMRLLARGYANTHIMAYGINLTDDNKVRMTQQRLEALTAVAR